MIQFDAKSRKPQRVRLKLDIHGFGWGRFFQVGFYDDMIVNERLERKKYECLIQGNGIIPKSFKANWEVCCNEILCGKVVLGVLQVRVRGEASVAGRRNHTNQAPEPLRFSPRQTKAFLGREFEFSVFEALVSAYLGVN